MDEDEEIIIGDAIPEEEPKPTVSEAKLKKLRNLKYFREWPEEKIIEWIQLREGKEAPPASPDDVGKDIAVPASVPDEAAVALADTNSEDYKKKFNNYLNKYKKEFGVDMNESNDAESLRAYVRYVIQLEQADDIIRTELMSKNPDHRILKGLGDFQRSLQMNQNEIQDKLGISRKQRKEKVSNDIPEYIKMLQDKAKDFWERKTHSIRCATCQIELARLWINFPDITKKITFEGTCEHCRQEVVYVA